MRAAIIVLSIFSILSAYQLNKNDSVVNKLKADFQQAANYNNDLIVDDTNLRYQLQECKMLVRRQ